jgi:hypothetical protein
MNELKQELDMDEHKIPAAELYKRLKTSPDKVQIKIKIKIQSIILFIFNRN